MSSKTIFRVPSLPCCCAAALWLVAGCTAPATTPIAPAAPQPIAAESASASSPLKLLDYSGSQQSLEALDRAIVAAGADATKVSALVRDLVELLKQPDATFTAQQAAGQRLGQLLSRADDIATAVATLAPLLTDERLANVARLALEPVPGAAVDAAFLHALAEADNGNRLALVQSIGNRRIASAVPALTSLLSDKDEHIAAAATKALGQIGNTAALAALTGAPNPAARPMIEARLACAWRLPTADGTAVFQSVFADARVSAAQRAFAWRALLDREPSEAVQRIDRVLTGEDIVAQRIALEAIATLPAKELAPTLLSKLDSYDAPTKSAVIAALARRHEAALVPAAAKALADPDPAVRTTALAALGQLPGNADVANQLAQFLVTVSGDDAKLARQSFARLNGPGVNDAILAGAASGEPRLRAVWLEMIGLRGMTEALPLLWKIRADPDGGVRAAAVRAAGEIAPASDQAAMLAWTIAATDSQEITRAQRALVSISQRNHDAVARDHLITDAVDRGGPADQLRLLPAVTRLGDTPALECTGRLALSPAANVASAAIDALARWPERSALPLLVAAAEKSPLDDARQAAVKGAIGFLERTRVAPSAEPSEVVARLLAVAKPRETRQSLLLLLGRGASSPALALAEKLQTDTTLADDARDAALAIHANQVWPPVVTASAGTGQLGNLTDGNAKTAWSAPANTDQWIQVDCKKVRPMRRITLDETGRPGDFPGKVEVFVTDDPAQPGTVRASATGRREKTVIDLPAGIRGRYLIIKATPKRATGTWSITELQID